MLLVAIIDTGVDFFDEEFKRMKFVMKTKRPIDDSSFYNLIRTYHIVFFFLYQTKLHKLHLFL